MQSLASSPHLAQSLDPTHHSIIEPNPTHDSCQKVVRLDPTRLNPVQPNPSVAAIQVVKVVRCTRAHDPWGPTSEDQIAIFLKN